MLLFIIVVSISINDVIANSSISLIALKMIIVTDSV